MGHWLPADFDTMFNEEQARAEAEADGPASSLEDSLPPDTLIEAHARLQAISDQLKVAESQLLKLRADAAKAGLPAATQESPGANGVRAPEESAS